MPQSNTRRGQTLGSLRCIHILRLKHLHLADNSRDHLRRNRTRPVDHHRPYIKHRRLNSYARRSPIQHRIDPTIQILEHMRRCSRTGSPKPIRTRSCHRHSRPPNQLQRHRMRRHPHTHQRPSRRHRIRHRRSPRQQQRQRPRPESRHQRLYLRSLPRLNRGHPPHHPLIAHMHDHRIPARPLFRREYLPNRSRIKRIGSQPINRLSWKRDRATCTHQFRRPQHPVFPL